MIESIPDMPENVLGFSATGEVTGEDYETVLVPAIEERLKHSDKVRFLYYVGPDFTGYKAAAVWDDAKLGLKHMSAWEKIALVTDHDWLTNMVKAFGFMIPGHVKVFPNEQMAQAKEWVSS